MAEAKNGSGVRLYEQNWYAVAMSEEVAVGKVIGADYLDGRVVVWRGEDGVARVMNAWCAHLGADLSVGQVVRNEIRCAFHHWQYGDDGVCTRIPAGDKIPPKARVTRLPTVERWGLVWAFNGAEPLYAPPSFTDFAECDLRHRTVPVAEFPVEHWVLLTNSVDFQHLKVLHGLEFEFDPNDIRAVDYGLEYEMRFASSDFGAFDQRIRVFGTNTLCLRGTMDGRKMLTMYTGTPRPNGYTRGWMVSAAPRPRQATPEALEACEQQVAMTEAFFVGLIEQDAPVMNTIRFREGALVPADRGLARFLKYVREYPRANVLVDS
jgi:nitrite reductase/ring-hydroxylating ferredoxin subunit